MMGYQQIYPPLIRMVGGLYERVFHEPMGDKVTQFVHDLSYVTIGTLVATCFSLTFNILSGRLLGPAGYGQFTLVQSLGMVMYLPMLAGLNASLIKYTAEGEERERHKRLISTTYIIVLLLTVVTIILYLWLGDALASLFTVSPDLLSLSIIYAVLFVGYTLTTSTLLGLHEMKMYAYFQPVFTAIMLGALLFYWSAGALSFTNALNAMLLGYGITTIVIGFRIRSYLSLSIDRSSIRLLGTYAGMALISCITFTIYQNLGKLLLNRYLTVEDVGIYGVYYYAAFTVIALFSTIFTTVLFPAASRHGDVGAIFVRISRGVRYFLILGVPGVLVSELVMLKLFGAAYPVVPSLVLSFALTAVVVNTYGLFQWIFNAESIRGSKISLGTSVLITMLALVFIGVMVPSFGVHGAIGGLGMAFAVGTVVLYYRGRRYLGLA
jgi:O-antigen/teichoic acid export membrane protein